MPRSTTRFAYEAEFYRLQLEPYSAVTSDLLLVFRDNSNTTLVQTSRELFARASGAFDDRLALAASKGSALDLAASPVLAQMFIRSDEVTQRIFNLVLRLLTRGEVDVQSQADSEELQRVLVAWEFRELDKIKVTRWVPKVTDMKAISKVLDMEEDMQDEERKIRFEDPEHSVTSDDAPRDVFRCFTCSICGYKCFKKRLRHSHQKRTGHDMKSKRLNFSQTPHQQRRNTSSAASPYLRNKLKKA